MKKEIKVGKAGTIIQIKKGFSWQKSLKTHENLIVI